MKAISYLIILIGLLIPVRVHAELQKFSEKKNGMTLYGLKADNGKVKIPALYSSITTAKDSEKRVYFVLKDFKGFRSLVNPQGKTVIGLGDYSYIGFFTFSDQYIHVKSLGKSGIYDIKGKLILPIEFDYVSTNQNKVGGKYIVHSFSVELKGKKGLYDLSGKCLVPPMFSYIDTYYPDRQYIGTKNGLFCGLYDIRNHREIIPAKKYNHIQVLDEDWYGVSANGREVTLLHKDQEVFKGVGSYFKKIDDNLFEVHYGTKAGYVNKDKSRDYYVINTQGEIVEDFKYEPTTIHYKSKDSLVDFDYFSDLNLKWGVKKSNKIIIPCIYDNVSYSEQYNVFFVYKDSFQGISNVHGKTIIRPDKYHTVKFDSQKRYYEVFQNEYQGIVDSLGVEIFPPIKYRKIESISSSSNLFRVSKNGYYGVINQSNQEIIPCKFESLKLVTRFPAIGPFFEVSVGGKYGIFSMNGECIVPPVYTKVSIHDPKHYGGTFSYIETQNYQYCGVYDLMGNEIIPANTVTKISYSGKYTDFPHFSVTDSSGKNGIFDLLGNVLFPLSEYKHLNIKKDKSSSTGYSIHAMEDGAFDRTVVYELYTGKVLSDNKEEVNLRNLIVEGDSYFENRNYAKAAKSYTDVLKIKKLDYIIFNRGLSYYNQSKYNDALSDFKTFRSLTSDLNYVERVDKLISAAIQLQTEKENRTAQIISDLFGFALSVYTVATMPKSSNSNYNPSASSFSSSSADVSSRSTDDNQSSIGSSTKAKKKCGFCGGKGYMVEYTANFGINENPYCEECGKQVVSGHYHKTCSKCRGSGEY